MPSAASTAAATAAQLTRHLSMPSTWNQQQQQQQRRPLPLEATPPPAPQLQQQQQQQWLAAACAGMQGQRQPAPTGSASAGQLASAPALAWPAGATRAVPAQMDDDNLWLEGLLD